jgi:tRNA/rRNA methyltransferase
MCNHSPSNQSDLSGICCSILQHTRVVVVEPLGPLNVGAIARVMKNFGLYHLVIVAPQCDVHSPEARQMAVHAQDVLLGAQIVPDLATALQSCHYTLATTGRSDHIPFPLFSPREFFSQWIHWPPGSELALIFGREDRGLTHQELTQAHGVLDIPTHPEYLSLNLAQAVGICCYELFQAIRTDKVPPTISPDGIFSGNSPEGLPAPVEQLEQYYQQLEHLLLQIGYLYPHTAASRMEKFRHLYQRAHPSPQEVAMLRGILRQMDWALQSKMS